MCHNYPVSLPPSFLKIYFLLKLFDPFPHSNIFPNFIKNSCKPLVCAGPWLVSLYQNYKKMKGVFLAGGGVKASYLHVWVFYFRCLNCLKICRLRKIASRRWVLGSQHSPVRSSSVTAAYNKRQHAVPRVPRKYFMLNFTQKCIQLFNIFSWYNKLETVSIWFKDTQININLFFVLWVPGKMRYGPSLLHPFIL